MWLHHQRAGELELDHCPGPDAAAGIQLASPSTPSQFLAYQHPPQRQGPETRTAATRTNVGRIAGYLNATPQQGDETLANWGTFRVNHNKDEGDTNVKLVAAADNVMFRGGHGSCVIDDYRSSSGHQYREIACIVAGTNATTVIVGAAPPQDWHSQSPAIERAISAFKT